MTPTFDLLTKPWIPVICKDSGKPHEVGIREALLGAHELRELQDPVPILELGVYRLLVAILLDALRPRNWQDIGDLLQRESILEDRVGAYLDQHARRFHLFGDRPFLQDASLGDAEPKTVALLNPAIPSVTNALHFHRQRESQFAVCPAVAARLLCAIPAFMTMGGAGLSPSINGAPPWYVLVRGHTLRETLLLNANTLWRTLGKELGVPAWRRQGPPLTGKQERATALESLTWQPRRVLFFPEDAGKCALSGRHTDTLIRSMAFVAGAGVDFVWEQDPNVAYRRAKEGVFPLRPQEGRELWRDTGAFALAPENPGAGQAGDLRPAVVSQFALLGQGYVKPGPLRLRAYGMRTDLKTKVFEWQREELELPPDMTWNGAASNHAAQAMERAEKVGRLLRDAIKRAYPRDGQGNKNAFETRVVSSRAQFWQSIRLPYEEYLRDLAARPRAEWDALGDRWERIVREQARQALDAAIDDLDADAAELRRQTEARRFFQGATYLVFHPDARKTRKTPTVATTAAG